MPQLKRPRRISQAMAHRLLCLRVPGDGSKDPVSYTARGNEMVFAGETEMDRRREGQAGAGRGQRGYSLPELLIVIAIMGLFILFAGPAMAEAYRAYKVRAVANNLATDLRAQRYNAVAGRTPRTLTANNQA